MALALGELVHWGVDKLHYDNRYFLSTTDFGFQTSRRVDVAIEHDTMSPFRFTHQATLIKAADGILFLHALSEGVPEELAIIQRIRAGKIFLSPGVQVMGKNNHRTLRLPNTHYSRPTPILAFDVREASYCSQAGQGYLPPVELIL